MLKLALLRYVQLGRRVTLRDEIVDPRRWNRTLTLPLQIAPSPGRTQYRASTAPGGQMSGTHLLPGFWDSAMEQNLRGTLTRPVDVNVNGLVRSRLGVTFSDTDVGVARLAGAVVAWAKPSEA